jgi:4-hydroxy-3-methylbut-2-en-1-yl diphosphate reductase
MTGALVAVPMRAERLALGRALPGAVVVGGGPRRIASATVTVESLLRTGDWSALLVAGTCGALAADLAPGDLVVASEVTGEATRVRCPAAPAAAASLRATGRRVHIGQIRTAGRYVDGPDRRALAGTGALAVDTESAVLAALAAASGLPVLVVRAVSDTPRHPLRSAGILRSGLLALRALHAAAPVLATWAAHPDPAPAEKEVG